MKKYTLTLVTWMPFTQTVEIEAENQDEAIFAMGDHVVADGWVVDPSHTVELDDVEVETISPEDSEEDSEDSEDDAE